MIEVRRRSAFLRICRGLSSAALGLMFPLGGWHLGRPSRLFDPARLERGLTIVLPGVEGWGPMSRSIAQGVIDGGFPGAVRVFDWTTGLWPLFVFHLRAKRRAVRRAEAVAQQIRHYRDQYPGQPVHLIGHSGGAAVAVWALEALMPGVTVDAVVLLAPALSPSYDLSAALRRAERGVWNFWSPLDLIFLAAGTIVFGTSDGRHGVAAGCRGFRLPRGADDRAKLRQPCYRSSWLARFHWGGHLSSANRVFVAETVAPLLGDGPGRPSPEP